MTTITRDEKVAMSDAVFDREHDRATRQFIKLNPAIATARTGLELYRELHVALDRAEMPSTDATNLMAMITRVRHAYDIPLDK